MWSQWKNIPKGISNTVKGVKIARNIAIDKRLKETWVQDGYKYTVRIHPAEAKYGKASSINS